MAMTLILAIVKPFKVAAVVDALKEWESFPSMTVFHVRGFRREKTAPTSTSAPRISEINVLQ